MDKQQNDDVLVPCPLCDGRKKKLYLVCFSCHNRYEEECKKQEEKYNEIAADTIYQGIPTPPKPTKISKEEWGKIEISLAIPRLKEEVEKTGKALTSAEKEKTKIVEEIYKAKVGDKMVSPEIRAGIIRRIEDNEGREIWRNLDGNKLFRDLRMAEDRLREAQRLLEDLSSKKANCTDPIPIILREVEQFLAGEKKQT